MLSNLGNSNEALATGAASCTGAVAGGGGGAPQEATGGEIGGRAAGANAFTGDVTGGSGAIGSAAAVSPQLIATGRGGLTGAAGAGAGVVAGPQPLVAGTGGAVWPFPLPYVPLFSGAADGATNIGPIWAICCVSSFISGSGSATGSGSL